MKSLAKSIDAILPQTQCRECSYAGCHPYAEAIAEQHERIDRCVPGGVNVLKKIAELTRQNAEPYIEEMQRKTRLPALAYIRENECIGCTKCIQACPVDAIIGAAKQLHVILKQECTGCGLCVEPCPVDCIELHALSEPHYDPALARARYEAREIRLNQQAQEKQNIKAHQELMRKKAYINDALARVRAKKQQDKSS